MKPHDAPHSLSHLEAPCVALGLAAAARGAALAAGAVRVDYKKAPDLAARKESYVTRPGAGVANLEETKPE
jgi:hypothetical protein